MKVNMGSRFYLPCACSISLLSL